MIPFILPWDDATETITDLSSWNHKPAGSRGFVRADESGHFAVGKDRLRIWGVNIGPETVFTEVPDPNDYGRFAARLAKFGFNSVRFHHMCAGWGTRNIFGDVPNPATTKVDPVSFDRFCRWVAAFKEAGIYTNLNLLVSRHFVEADGLPREIEDVPWKDQGVVAFWHPVMIELQKDYARQMLASVNPHTGMRLADDPALAIVEINNEAGLIHGWYGGQVDGVPDILTEPLRRRWAAFLQERYQQKSALEESWGIPQAPENADFNEGVFPIPRRGETWGTSGRAQADWIECLYEVEADYWTGIRDFLVHDLGVRVPVVGTIASCSPVSIQARLDAVDTHAYWQHPKFPGIPWDSGNWTIDNISMVNQPDGGTLANLSLYAVRGKPHLVTEYDHPFPNQQGGEAAPLIAAYGALQDWDAIYFFIYGHRRTQWDDGRVGGFFDWMGHPTKMANAVSGAAMFRRGDVSPAVKSIEVALSREQELEALTNRIGAWRLTHMGHLGIDRRTALQHRLRFVLDGEPGSTEKPALPAENRVVSDTDELTWDCTDKDAGLVVIDTARTQGFVGYPGNREIAFKDAIMKATAPSTGWCTALLTLLEGERIGQTGRAVLILTGNVENTDMRWTGPERVSVGTHWGSGPSVVEVIDATVSVPGRVRVFALDERGARCGDPIAVTDNGGRSTFSVGSPHKTIWYELLWE